MNNTGFTCCRCGGAWTETPPAAKKVVQATKVNHDGPYCVLCLYLTIVQRICDQRGIGLLDACDDFLLSR